MSYYCTQCKKEVDIDYENSGVRCPHCGQRILIKRRPTTITKIKAE